MDEASILALSKGGPTLVHCDESPAVLAAPQWSVISPHC